jgi:amidase
MSTGIHGFSTAGEMLHALARRQISAVELLELHRERIARHNPALNVIVEPDLERAQAAAADADVQRAHGTQGALLGLPITLKESINVVGLRTTVGMPMWASFRSEHDAPLTQRVRSAGAVLMGKTNVAPMLADWQADNEVYGRTNNPWDLARTPGGSTGGAAAVAAGLTPLEFGSDIGGSIRVPAGFCGVYGHRSSDSALARSGQFPFPPAPNPAIPMAVQGPLARSAEDLLLAFDVVSGPEVGEDVAWKLQLPAPRHRDLRDYRVAVLPPVPFAPVDAEILAAQDQLLSRLSAHGCKVGVAHPELDDFRQFFALYLTFLTAINSIGVPHDQIERQIAGLKRRQDEWSAARLRALSGRPADYATWHGQRERFRAAFRSFFRDWDVLLCPVFVIAAFHHRKRGRSPTGEPGPSSFEVNGSPLREDLGLFHPSLATLPGQPATAFPVARTPTGLPIGLQAIGPYLEDYTTLRFAALVAREWGGFVPPPGY